MKRYSTFVAILAFSIITLVSSQAFSQTVEGQRKGLRNGTRINYVDADGDGVCDNQGTRSGERLLDGSGKGGRNGSGGSGGGRGRK